MADHDPRAPHPAAASLPPLARSTTQTDWRNPASYSYTRSLTRDAWAWEFLRRNPKYRAAWDEITRGGRPLSTAEKAATGQFEVLSFEDPKRTALETHVLWTPRVSSFVLPLRVERERSSSDLERVDLSTLSRRAVVKQRDGAVHHLLFNNGGRRLQLAVEADCLRGCAALLTNARLDGLALKRRISLLQRLSDFLATGHLAERLYPPGSRNRRFAILLRALDGWLAENSQRVIGESVFEGADIDRDWRDCECPLRDRLRLILRRARWLMDGGYVSLLR